MSIKKSIIIVFSIIGSLLIIAFVSGLIRINAGTDLVSVKPTKLSFMIMDNKISDSDILKEIDKDNSLLFETCFDCDDHCIPCKTPILAAILYERIDLAKKMLRRGAPSDVSLEILRNKSYLGKPAVQLENLVNEMVK